MAERLQNIISYLRRSGAVRIVFHIVFWIIVAFFYFFLFSWNSEYQEASVILSAGLLPVAIGMSYFFNYSLVPRYLSQKRYARFFLFSFYTLLVGIWLSFLIIFYTLIYILNNKAAIDTSVLHPEWQVITLNFIVFFAIAVKQIKRAFFMQQEKNEMEKTQLNMELKLKEAELKLLKAQIHPHFLFNTLNNLYGLTLEKSNEAPDLVLRLSEILNYILYGCDEPRVALTDELENLKNYIEIEKIRYSDKLQVRVDFPAINNELEIAPLVLLPFVENAFKHGVSNNPGQAFVKVGITLHDTTLIFKIENSKNPLQVKEGSYSKGIGLSNVQKRLDFIYPGKYILKINNGDETFSVNLTLELEE